MSKSRYKRRERGVWQQRFWKLLIRDGTDYCNHVNYIRWNTVKHAWVRRVKDCPHSSFHYYVASGFYPDNWGGKINFPDIETGE